MKRFAESFLWRVVLYLVLVVCTAASASSLLVIVWLGSDGLYEGDGDGIKRYMLRESVIEHFYDLCETHFFDSEWEWLGALEEDGKDSNLYYTVTDVSQNYTIFQMLTDFDEEDDVYTYIWNTEIMIRQEIEDDSDIFELKSIGDFEIIAYAGPSYYSETFALEMKLCDWVIAWREALIVLAIGGCLFGILDFVWLMCLAGHKRGIDGIAPSVWNFIPLDLLTVSMGAVALAGVAYLSNFSLYGINNAVCASGALTLETLWCTLYCQELATRLKLGNWWRNTILYRLARLAGRAATGIGHALGEFVRSLPYIWVVAAVVLAVSAAEFLFMLAFREAGYWGTAELIPYWFLEKIPICGVIFYCAVMQVRIRKGTQRLAQGDYAAKVNLKSMLYLFRDTAADLNRIGDGLSVAVEKRMQSERLKTELITNVSHDIKTPLTSIINYASLLGEEAGNVAEQDREKLAEYSEVLLRQSQRLKKLLEDLVEASKATTGNLEVHLDPCELDVLLTQAAGEYEERLRAKALDLHISTPGESVRILADGRHLWRVFDNLLGNICKYAQENSRVYLNVAREGDQAVVIFRNMSKYELNVSAEELTERFVRGDSSRHMEGSGLGLSIAQSLVELQQGTMEIVTDGDLFKVVLRFPVAG